MIFVKAKELDIINERNKKERNVRKMLREFKNSSYTFVEVIDNDNEYKHSGDLRRAVSYYVNKYYKYEMKSFMSNGRVYVKKI